MTEKECEFLRFSEEFSSWGKNIYVGIRDVWAYCTMIKNLIDSGVITVDVEKLKTFNPSKCQKAIGCIYIMATKDPIFKKKGHMALRIAYHMATDFKDSPLDDKSSSVKELILYHKPELKPCFVSKDFKKLSPSQRKETYFQIGKEHAKGDASYHVRASAYYRKGGWSDFDWYTDKELSLVSMGIWEATLFSTEEAPATFVLKKMLKTKSGVKKIITGTRAWNIWYTQNRYSENYHNMWLTLKDQYMSKASTFFSYASGSMLTTAVLNCGNEQASDVLQKALCIKAARNAANAKEGLCQTGVAT